MRTILSIVAAALFFSVCFIFGYYLTARIDAFLVSAKQPDLCPTGYYVGIAQISDGTCTINASGHSVKCFAIECFEYGN